MLWKGQELDGSLAERALIHQATNFKDSVVFGLKVVRVVQRGARRAHKATCGVEKVRLNNKELSQAEDATTGKQLIVTCSRYLQADSYARLTWST